MGVISHGEGCRKARKVGPRPRSRGPRPARRRVAWRFHLGRARQTSRGALAQGRGDLRHVGRRDERGRAGQRLDARRGGDGAFRARRLLEPRRGSRAIQSAPALAARSADEPLDAGHLPRLSRDGPDDKGRFALRPQPVWPQSDQVDPVREHRLRPSRRGADQALHHRDQRAYRPWAHLPQPRNHARGPSRLRLPAHHVPGDRDRRRAVLGRRLRREPDNNAAHSRKRRARHDPRPDQPSGTPRHTAYGERDSEPPQRDFVQCPAYEGAADDRALAARRPIRVRAKARGGPACVRTGS